MQKILIQKQKSCTPKVEKEENSYWRQTICNLNAGKFPSAASGSRDYKIRILKHVFCISTAEISCTQNLHSRDIFGMHSVPNSFLRKLLSAGHCHYHQKLVLICSPKAEKCLSTEKLLQRNEDFKEYWISFEEIVAKILPGFSFRDSCEDV